MSGSGSLKAFWALRTWLECSERAHGFWLGRYCVAAAWMGLALAAFSPPHGSGLPWCWVYGATGLPCPGCGMTRSLSCALRGMWGESWTYHPFGLFVLPLFVLTAAQSLLPGPVRSRLKRLMQAHAPFFNGLYLTFVVAFVAFGATRALLHGAQLLWLPN
jgi:hypothetical protein